MHDVGAEASPVAIDRQRLSSLADQLIPGGDGLPSANEADVHDVWMDRVLAARPDLVGAVMSATGGAGDPETDLERLKDADAQVYNDFCYAVAGAYLMNPRVRGLLGLPRAAPVPNPAPDQADYSVDVDLLQPVLRRGPIYRPTP